MAQPSESMQKKPRRPCLSREGPLEELFTVRCPPSLTSHPSHHGGGDGASTCDDVCALPSDRHHQSQSQSRRTGCLGRKRTDIHSHGIRSRSRHGDGDGRISTDSASHGLSEPSLHSSAALLNFRWSVRSQADWRNWGPSKEQHC
jgi:hypothetical protein